MNVCSFYRPDGSLMSEDEFVSYYGARYYIGGRGVPRSSPSSRYVENTIDRLLKCGIKEKIDIVHILAWKIGKIKHKESDKTNRFQYAKDWRQAENFDVTRYGKAFDLDGIASFVASNIEELEREADENPQLVLDRLYGEHFYGLGPVYLLTLLYFISKGKYPIYDRFAQMALTAIHNDVKPGGIVNFKALSGSAFSTIMKREMEEYNGQMERVFGEKYQDSRDIDRALWVYGHFFKVK